MRDRLDKVLHSRGLAASRSRARDLIVRGQVRVADRIVDDPAALVEKGVAILVAAGSDYVPSGGAKLAAGLAAFAFDAKDRIALDVGASTGGFTEVLLAGGAAKVYAVDVGHGQMHCRIKDDPRVVSLERCDARGLTQEQIPEPVSAIVADVSFISLVKALPAPLALAARGAWLVVLVKPQFEAGPSGVGKGGIVRDDAVREAAVASVADWLGKQAGWRIRGIIPSPITGGSGNQEFLL